MANPYLIQAAISQSAKPRFFGAVAIIHADGTVTCNLVSGGSLRVTVPPGVTVDVGQKVVVQGAAIESLLADLDVLATIFV